MPKDTTKLESSSFRDPSGTVFYQDDTIYRAVSDSYQKNYDLLHSSGLYQTLVDQQAMVAHQEVKLTNHPFQQAYKIIKPEHIPVISYPYEWSFSQLQDAALLTLHLQKTALKHGMSLKDATAYNIQFVANQPVLIDTLSFEAYQPKPWVAYKQFCQHFLAPLALMAHTDLRLQQLLQTNIDGIPLDLASRLLPPASRLRPGLLIHIHLHGKNQVSHASDASKNLQAASQSTSVGQVSLQSLLGMLDSLESAVKKLKAKGQNTEWASYYINNNNYVDQALQHKQQLVGDYLKQLKAKSATDIGANTGLFSMVAADQGIQTIALDIDPLAVDSLYQYLKSEARRSSPVASRSTKGSILPLVSDIANPSPGIGWHNTERRAILDRIQADAIMGLAVVHHLAIPLNIPLAKIALLFHQLSHKGAIVEFIPKQDSQVQILLATRQDIFTDYTKEGFEAAFGQYFKITKATPIKDSHRILYLLEKK